MPTRLRASKRRLALETRLAALVPGPLRQRLRGRLGAETVPVSTLDPATRHALYTLYRDHYERTDERRFFADLDDKHDVILLRDLADGALAGFSTQHVSTLGPTVIVFSGDTIIAPAYHGQSALQRAFVRYVLEVARQHRGAAVYWFLISKGYKTYLLLSRNFPSYWPRFDQPTPPAIQRLMDQAATTRFGAAYDPRTGVVRFDPPGPRLADDVAPLPSDPAPDVAFFAARNPGHADGDELCCLGRIDLWLGFAFGRRLGAKVLRRLAAAVGG
jgi:hypothetical protein